MYCDHRYLHVLTPSFPTRRSPDLAMRSIAILRAGLVTRAQNVVTQIVDALRAIVERHGRKQLTSANERARVEARRHRQRVLEFDIRSEEHTSELQSIMRISYAVF